MGCPADVLEWYEEMGLLRRMAALKKNASVAAADAVLVAEAVHHYYPKLVQLHSYTEQNNTAGRLSNWKHLNNKVLKPMRCDLSEDQMMRFASRQSEREMVEYLRELRIRLPSFEPLYLAEYHVGNDAASQKMSVARMMKPAPQRSYSVTSDASSVLTESTYESSSVASTPRGPKSPPHQPMGTNLARQSSGSTIGATSKRSVRRPSAAQSSKLLEARKGREEIARRASLLSTTDIEAQFRMLSGKIKKETIALTSETDELDRKSQTLDAQMSALQKQNQSELMKIDKRLSVLRLELSEAETGQSVVISDDINYNSMVDPNKNAFAREVSDTLKLSAMEVSSLDVARGAVKFSPQGKSGSPSPQNGNFSTGATNSIPFGGGKMLVGKSAGNEYDEYSEGSYAEDGSSVYSEDEDDSDYETDDSEPPPPPPPKPKVTTEPKSDDGNNSTEKIPAQKELMTVSELDVPKSPMVPSVIKSAITTYADRAKHQSLHPRFTEQQHVAESESEENSSDEEKAFQALSAMKRASASLRIPESIPAISQPSGAPTDPPKPATKPLTKPLQKANVQDPEYRRCYDKTKQRFYYVNLKSGESRWRAPSEGVVLCVDKDNREYLFDVVTEKSTWAKR